MEKVNMEKVNMDKITWRAERSKIIVSHTWREYSQESPESPAVFAHMASYRALSGQTVQAEIEAARLSLIVRESLASKARRLFGLDLRADVNASTLFWA